MAKNIISQKGVAIYLAMVIMSVILLIGIGMSTIIIGQIKISTGIGNSVVALYAADTGIERALYEEKLCRQIDCSSYSCGAECSAECICSADCRGLNQGCIISSLVGNSSYNTNVIYAKEDGKDVVKITSAGEYKETKRAIETTISRPPPLVFTVTLNCPDPVTNCDVEDWVRFTSSAGIKDTQLMALESINDIRSLIRWSLADIPNNTTIESATFFFYRTSGNPPAAGKGVNIMQVDNDSWSSATPPGSLWTWPAVDYYSYSNSNIPGWVSVDIKSLVEANNVGVDDKLSLKWEYFGLNIADFYASPSYNGIPANKALRPYIEVQYHY